MGDAAERALALADEAFARADLDGMVAHLSAAVRSLTEAGDARGTELLAQEVDALRAEVAELAERLDFAERLLAAPRDPATSVPPRRS